METIDFSKLLKDLYTATQRPKEVRALAGTFLAMDGQGAPGGEAFQQAVQALYSAVYTLKFALKHEGVVDFKVSKLECLYFSEPHKTPMDQWQWRFLVRVPEEVTSKALTQTKKSLREKKGLDLTKVKRIRWKEGPALQVLHVGPYDQVEGTYCLLESYAQEHGLAIKGPAHEIYISDPRRVAPEKLKTIIRLGVEKG
jgi:hypothetical protein